MVKEKRPQRPRPLKRPGPGPENVAPRFIEGEGIMSLMIPTCCGSRANQMKAYLCQNVAPLGEARLNPSRECAKAYYAPSILYRSVNHAVKNERGRTYCEDASCLLFSHAL